MILKLLDGVPSIGRRALQDKLSGLSADKVKYHLKKLVALGHATIVGGGRNSKYKQQ